MDDYESQLRHFGKVEKEVDLVGSVHVIGALSLNTNHVKTHLRNECNQWKIQVRMAWLTLGSRYTKPLSQRAQLTLLVVSSSEYGD